MRSVLNASKTSFMGFGNQEVLVTQNENTLILKMPELKWYNTKKT